VSYAAVEVNGQTVGKIHTGLVAFAAVGREDTDKDLLYIAEKLTNLRLFEDDQGRLNRSVREVDGGILAISNFTVYGDCRKGRRPNFTAAAPPAEAETLFERFLAHLKATGVPVATGQFGARMKIHVVNEGPVTVLLDSRKRI